MLKCSTAHPSRFFTQGAIKHQDFNNSYNNQLRIHYLLHLDHAVAFSSQKNPLISCKNWMW